MEGFEVATATLLEKLSICEFYSGIYNGVLLPSQSTENVLKLMAKLEYALPELYAAVVVFSVKARTYFEAKGTHLKVFIKLPILNEPGIKKIASKLKSFDLEFQPFIDEVNAKEGVIRECADAATMERVRSKCNPMTRLPFHISCWIVLDTSRQLMLWLQIGSVDKSFYLLSFVCSFHGGAGLGAPPCHGFYPCMRRWVKFFFKKKKQYHRPKSNAYIQSSKVPSSISHLN